jgi:hypothetical protein
LKKENQMLRGDTVRLLRKIEKFWLISLYFTQCISYTFITNQKKYLYNTYFPKIHNQ